MSGWTSTQHDTSYIYVVGSFEHMNLVKIGVSCNPPSRLTQLQISSPFHLHMWGTFAVPMLLVDKVEKYLHKMLVDCHKRGEWFNLPPKQALLEVDKLINQFLKPKKQCSKEYEAYSFEKTLESAKPSLKQKVLDKL